MKSGPILSDTLKDSVGDAVAEEALFAGYKWVDEQVVQKKAS
jgi:hypothetical protein